MNIPVKNKILKKTTVREEIECWNIVYILRRLNIWYARYLYSRKPKDLQGMEAADFSLNVISKIVSGERSWEKSTQKDFMAFVYGVAKSEASTWTKRAKNKSFISLDIKQENKSNLHIREDFNGF
jgi:hypothetical protein